MYEIDLTDLPKKVSTEVISEVEESFDESNPVVQYMEHSQLILIRSEDEDLYRNLKNSVKSHLNDHLDKNEDKYNNEKVERYRDSIEFREIRSNN